MARDTRKKLAQHNQMLPVKLSKEELLERAQKVGKVHEELGEHRMKADAMKKGLREKEAALESEQGRLSHILLVSAEPRPVLVQAWADFERNTFEEIRDDTKEVIFKRKLEMHERQKEFEDFDKGHWHEQLKLRLLKAEEDIAKKRAGDVDTDDDDPVKN